MTIKIEDQKWDIGAVGAGRIGPLPTANNFRNQDRVMRNLSSAWRETGTVGKVAAVMSMVSLISGLIAISESYVLNKPGEAACIAWSVVSGVSGFSSIVLCCIGCAQN